MAKFLAAAAIAWTICAICMASIVAQAEQAGLQGATDDRSVPEILAHLATTQQPFGERRSIAEIESGMRRERDPEARMTQAFSLASALLIRGESESALQVLLEMRRVFEMPQVRVDPRSQRQLREQLSLTYLRLGEQENCIHLHGRGSCLLPIAEEARHQQRRGSEGAMRELTALLQDQPELGWRWLLSLAAMTLGRYPDAVPEEHQLPPGAFDPEIPWVPFEDQAAAAGVDVIGLSGGAAMDDFDGDGWLDLVASSWGLADPLRFFRNLGDGTFEDASAAAGLTEQLGGLNLNHADYDNDGDLDLLVLRGGWLADQGQHPNSLLQNQGDGTFRDVTREAGLLSLHPTQTAAWADFDRDGWLDLFIGNETTSFHRGTCELFRGQGDGTFVEVASEVGLDVIGFVKAAVWGDADNDGWPDLYLSRFGEPNLLFHNIAASGGSEDDTRRSADKGRRFVEVGRQARVSAPLRSFPAWFWDVDNDGREDLLVAPFADFTGDALEATVADFLGQENAAEKSRLYLNVGADGEVRFEDASERLGLRRSLLAMGGNFGDIDNDGWLDAYFGTGEPNLRTLVPNRLFRNTGPAGFQEVTLAAGVGHLQKGHGIAFGDIDNDGDQDIYAVLGGAYSGDVYQNALFINPGSDHAWVVLKLEGTLSNRSAIGARLQIDVRPREKSQRQVARKRRDRSLHRTVGTGGSFGSSSLRQEVGLGDVRGIERVVVRWPSPGGETSEIFKGVQPYGFYLLREGSGRAQRLPQPKLSSSRRDDG